MNSHTNIVHIPAPVLAVVVAGLAIAAVTSCGSNTTAPTTAATTAASSATITGSQEDWLQAVCAPGKYFDGTSIQGATGGGFCQSRSRSTSVFFSQWDSNFKMLNALSQYHMSYYTSAFVGGSADIDTFSVNGNDSAALRPLQQFGFSLNSVSR
jgi:hypothetical protein